MKKNTCSRCGECCRWLVLGGKEELTAEEIRYYGFRGATERQGLFVLEHPCTMLEYVREEDGAIAGAGEITDENLRNGSVMARCSVHGEKPEACRVFDGRRKRGGTVFYIPERCTMAAGRGKKKARE